MYTIKSKIVAENQFIKCSFIVQKLSVIRLKMIEIVHEL